VNNNYAMEFLAKEGIKDQATVLLVLKAMQYEQLHGPIRKLYLALVERKCVERQDFHSWHGKLLDAMTMGLMGSPSPYTEGSYRGFRPSDENDR
jgi:hypothetical protein